MGNRLRCCGRLCTICVDYFDRADNTDISPFVEIDGDWAISGEELYEAGTLEALARCQTRHPERTRTAVVSVTLRHLSQGNKYLLFCNLDPDDPLPWEALEGIEFYCDGVATATMSIVGSSVSQSEIPYEEDGEITISICRNINTIWGDNSTTDHYVFDTMPETPTDRFYAGVGNPGEEPIYFDYFRYYEHWVTNNICTVCPCSCDGYSFKRTLLVTIVIEGDDCPEHLVDTFEGTITVAESTSSGVIWRGTIDMPNCANDGTVTIDIEFTCNHDLEDWGMTINDDTNEIFGGEVSLGATVTCSPITATVSTGEHVSCGDDCFATFYVTDAPEV